MGCDGHSYVTYELFDERERDAKLPCEPSDIGSAVAQIAHAVAEGCVGHNPTRLSIAEVIGVQTKRAPADSPNAALRLYPSAQPVNKPSRRERLPADRQPHPRRMIRGTQPAGVVG